MILSFVHIAKDWCQGEGGTLARKSTLFAKYPCSGTDLERALYILRHPYDSLRDQITIAPVWVSGAYVACLLRLPLAVLLGPSRFYDWAATGLTYVARLLPFFWHAVVYDSRLEPIAQSVWYFRQFSSTLDLYLFLTLPGPTAGVEAMVGTVNMACLAVMSYQYGKHHPHLGISLMTQIPRQAVVFLVCLYLAYRSGSRRRNSTSSIRRRWRSIALQWRRRAWIWGGPAPLPEPAVPDDGGSSAVKPERARLPACQAAGSAAGCGTASEGPVASAVIRVSSLLAGAIAPSTSSGANGFALGAAPNSRTGLPIVDRASCAESVIGSGGAWPSAAQHAATGLPRSAAGDAPRRPPRYRSFVKRSAVFVKIPGCDPTQIAPGFEARLAAALAATDAAAAAGGRLRLAGVYVREGCIELLFEVAEWCFPPTEEEDAIAAGSVSMVASMEGGCAGSRLLVAAGAPGTADCGILRVRSIGGLTLSNIIAALQLQGNSEAGGEGAAVSGAAAATWTVATGCLGSLAVTPRVLLLPADRDGEDLAAASAEAQPKSAGVTVRIGALADQAASSDLAAAPPAMAAAVATGAAAAALPPAPDELEVLVRCRGAYLPVSVAWRRRGGERAAAANVEVEEDAGTGGEVAHRDVEAMEAVLELQQLPLTPGELVIDVRRRGLPWSCAPLLLLTDPRVAAELAAPLAGWEGPGEELDGLLRDLAAWDAHTCSAAAAVAEAEASTATFSAYGQPVAPQMLAALGRHLLEYATATGWVHTAERIRSGLDQLQGSAEAGLGTPLKRPAGVSCEGAAAAGATATAPAAGRAVLSDASASRAGGMAVADSKAMGAVPSSAELSGGSGADGSSTGKSSCGKVDIGLSAGAIIAGDSRGRSGASGRRAASGGDCWGGWAHALLLVLGLRRAPAEEEEAFRAYAQPWVFAQGHAMRVVGTLSLLATLLRCALDRHLPSGAPAVLLAGLGAGALSSAAKLLLPYPAWARLEARCRPLHYVGLMVAKGLIAFCGFPAPPGIQPYLWAPGMLALEGIILPGSCLLSPRVALLVLSLLNLVTAAEVVALEPATRPAAAALLAGRTALAGVATNLACHVLMRCCFERRRRGCVGDGWGNGDGAEEQEVRSVPCAGRGAKMCKAD